MTRGKRWELEAALVQAIIDNDVAPDGPVLSERFWNLLAKIDDATVIRQRAANADIIRGQWRERS